MRRLMFIAVFALLVTACGSTPAPAASGDAPAQVSGLATAAPKDAPKPTEPPKPTAAPKPTETPEPTAEPTAEPAAEGASRSNPLPLGTGLHFETWAITVTEVLRGEEAASAVKKANQFNDPAPEGYEYLLATVQIENISTKQKAENTSLAIDLRVTGDRNMLYSRTSVVPPKPFEGELFPGGAAEGQVAFTVPTDEKKLMFFVGESLSFDPAARRFVAIDEGAKLAPSADLAAVKVTDIGAKRNSPAKPGETVTTEAWEVAVLEVQRGEAAAKLAKEANQFNDPSEAGMEYVAVKLRVRYIGEDDPDKAEHISGGSFKITGEKNKVYERVSVVPPKPQLEGYLFPGGQVEGWDILSVAEGEQKLALVFEPLFSFSNDDMRFLALE